MYHKKTVILDNKQQTTLYLPPKTPCYRPQAIKTLDYFIGTTFMSCIRLATLDDVPQIAIIHQANFIRQMHSKTWIHASIAAHPRFLVYVLVQNHTIVGYVIWTQKSGFRQKAVLELDQIAILPAYQGQGLAKQLIQESITDINYTLQSQNQHIKAILVSTAQDNPAQMLYQKVLDVQTVATLTGVYDKPEILMLKTFE